MHQTPQTLKQKIDISHKTHLQKYNTTLSQLQLQQIPKFTLTGSGSVMITASHNPGYDNGIKIGYTNQKIIPDQIFKLLEKLINSEELFQKFIDERYEQISLKMAENNKKRICFLGRDSRTSSPQLSKIANETLTMLGINVIDFGICTTPELYSLSRQILEKINTNENYEEKINVEQQKQSYVKYTIQNFIQTWKKLPSTQYQQPHKKPNILIDFSNGSGAISYLLYKPLLTDYFQIKQISNTDFNNPNHKCGAQYFHKNWYLVKDCQQFEGYDQCFFLDGDADRIIVKISGVLDAFDGNYFTMFYIGMLLRISAQLQKQGIISKNQAEQYLQIHAVGTVISNLGIKIQLQKQGINLITTNVGILNLHKQIIKLKGWTVFFEPNGHGGIYVSKQSYQKIEKLQRQYPDNLELSLLVTIKRILRNNAKGYGLNNMFVYYLCKKYLNLTPQDISQLFTLMHEDKKLINLTPQQDSFYKNGAQNNNELTQPKQVYHYLQELNKQYHSYKIVVRKSQTTKYLLRINVQGSELATCQSIIFKINDFIQKYNMESK